MFNNKNVLITGGTGSFGTLFIKKILKKFNPKKLIIYSRDELKQSLIAKKIKDPSLRFFIGDVRDDERLTLAMEGVDFVVHAAALKQVDAAEYNPMECIKTNVNGAENVVKAAIKNNVQKIIALSTDKASDPINLYGATKLTSDKIFSSANNIVGKKKIRFSIVRYGNVVGSRGSVVQIFDQFKKDQLNYFPITDQRMTRFWITLDEAVDFVFSCFFRMVGGEVFIPKIPSIKIVNLAKAMDPKKKHKIIGIRSGEKLHEKMISANESHLTLDFKNYYIIRPSIKFEKRVNYSKNNLGEKGKRVVENFEYTSDKNLNFLNIEQIKKINKKEGF
tara:strand:+ start:1147 stop:2145 length:999 start_codon:yes stop_codon:yes gene_type:complete